jgi:hypothetical protein
MTQRARIIAALVARLKTLKAVNGYASNAGSNVYSWFPENLQVPTDALPCLNVRDTSETIEELRDHTEHRLSVDVIGLISSGVTTDASARDLLGDIAEVIMSPTDRTLGGVCDGMAMTDGGTIQLEQATDGTRASVSLSLAVTYRTQRGDWSTKI